VVCRGSCVQIIIIIIIILNKTLPWSRLKAMAHGFQKSKPEQQAC
jgi:hypothetical protein